jgi:hypothetical protein
MTQKAMGLMRALIGVSAAVSLAAKIRMDTLTHGRHAEHGECRCDSRCLACR